MFVAAFIAYTLYLCFKKKTYLICTWHYDYLESLYSSISPWFG